MSQYYIQHTIYYYSLLILFINTIPVAVNNTAPTKYKTYINGNTRYEIFEICVCADVPTFTTA